MFRPLIKPFCLALVLFAGLTSRAQNYLSVHNMAIANPTALDYFIYAQASSTNFYWKRSDMPTFFSTFTNSPTGSNLQAYVTFLRAQAITNFLVYNSTSNSGFKSGSSYFLYINTNYSGGGGGLSSINNQAGTNLTITASSVDGAPPPPSLVGIRAAISAILTAGGGQNPTRSFNLFFCGDSTTSGMWGGNAGTTNSLIFSYPYDLSLLSPIVNADGWMGLHSGGSYSYLQAQDPRITSIGSWVSDQNGQSGVFNNTAWGDNGTNPAPFVFTTTCTANQVIIPITTVSGSPTIIVTTNGVTALTTNISGIGAVKILTVNFPLTNHIAIGIQKTNNTTVEPIFYGMIFNNTNGSLNVINCGSEGEASSGIIPYLQTNVFAATTNVLALLGTTNSATFYNLGINDFTGGGWPGSLTQFLTNLNIFAYSMNLIGEPALMLNYVPSSMNLNGANSNNVLSFISTLKAVAATNNYPFIDYLQILGGYNVAYTVATNNGFCNNLSGAHCLGVGYMDYARYLARVLGLPSGTASSTASTGGGGGGITALAGTTNAVPYVSSGTGYVPTNSGGGGTVVYGSILGSTFYFSSNTVSSGTPIDVTGETNTPITVTLPAGHSFSMSGLVTVFEGTGAGSWVGVKFNPAVSNLCSQTLICNDQNGAFSPVCRRASAYNSSFFNSAFNFGLNYTANDQEFLYSYSGNFQTVAQTTVTIYVGNCNVAAQNPAVEQGSGITFIQTQ